MMHSLSQEQLIPLSLKEVSAAFAQRRATRTIKSRISESLWQQVILFLNKYTGDKVIKTLNLCGGQVKAKMQCMANTTDTKHKLTIFVPVQLTISAAEVVCVVKLVREICVF